MSFRYFVRENTRKGEPARFYRVTTAEAEAEAEVWRNGLDKWDRALCHPLTAKGSKPYVELSANDLPAFLDVTATPPLYDFAKFRYFRRDNGRVYRTRKGHGPNAPTEFLLGDEWRSAVIWRTFADLQGSKRCEEIYAA